MSGQIDIINQIDWKSLECLNASSEHGVNNALKQGYRDKEGLYLESDADEQILLHIPFQTAVKLQSIVIQSSTDKDKAPKQIRLFINQPNLSFGDAADQVATQEFELTEEQLEGSVIPLKLVKFQKVNVLTIFVGSNQGGEETTIIQRISLTGTSGETFNVAEIKKIEH